MFPITAETCRRFTLGELLIMAAMNVAPALMATDKSGRTICHSPRTESHENPEGCHGKVIEFYIPKNFRKPFRTVAQAQLGKIIEFCPQTKRSA